MKYETATIASLMLDPANVRTHDSKNLESIKASLARFGQQTPIVVNSKGIVVAGNARLMAAKMLNWSSVEIVRTDLEGAEAIAYAIADNRTAELAGWDEAALAQQLAALQIDDEELANIAGFTDAEIEAMMMVGTKIENSENGKSVVESSEKYAESVIKQIVLVFDAKEYRNVIESFESYAEKNGLSDNTSVVIHLLEMSGYAIS
jgi:hypothetical protein